VHESTNIKKKRKICLKFSFITGREYKIIAICKAAVEVAAGLFESEVC